jgi:hypothetical protein
MYGRPTYQEFARSAFNQRRQLSKLSGECITQDILRSAHMELQRELTRSEYRWIAVGAAVIAVAGFARTYYLRSLFHGPALSPLVQVHGAAMTLWCIGFIFQTWLIEAGRVRLHMRLGAFMAVLAAIVVVLGEVLTLDGVARESRLHQIGRLHFLLGINTVNLLLFAGFVVLGIVYRRRPDLHKRLMVLAALTLLAPAVARIVLLFTRKPLPQFLAFYACFLLCVLIDTLRHRRLHPAFAIGVPVVVVAFHVSYLVVQTPAWMKVVTAHFG